MTKAHSAQITINSTELTEPQYWTTVHSTEPQCTYRTTVHISNHSAHITFIAQSEALKCGFFMTYIYIYFYYGALAFSLSKLWMTFIQNFQQLCIKFSINSVLFLLSWSCSCLGLFLVLILGLVLLFFSWSFLSTSGKTRVSAFSGLLRLPCLLRLPDPAGALVLFM